jgi:hypothetical protein
MLKESSPAANVSKNARELRQGLLRADCRFKPANVLGGLAANNVKQYSCFRSKLI